MNIQAALKARLSSLMVGAKGTMFNCRKSIPSDQLFEKPIVVELKNIGDDDEKAFLMGLLLTRLYEYRELRNPIDKAPEHGLRHMLVVEEAHRLLKNTPDGAETMETANVKAKAVSVFVDMLSEIRAYGQGVAVVDQVPSRLNANVIKGTAAKIVHRLLADDDRQTVGGCMGLKEEQIEGVCMLETGQTVVHQDGQRKAYLCKIEKSPALKPSPTKLESDGTNLFRKELISVLDPLRQYKETESVNVDREDSEFSQSLHLAMLATAFSSVAQAKKALSSLTPTRFRRKGIECEKFEIKPWFSIYWTQICEEVWAYHAGDFRDFNNFRMTGWQFLADWLEGNALSSSHKSYLLAVKGYLGLPSSKAGTLGHEDFVGNAYDQMITRLRSIAMIRERYVEKRNSKSDFSGCLAVTIEIKRLIPAPPFEPNQELKDGILNAILWRMEWNDPMRTKLFDRVSDLLKGEEDE